MDRTAGFAASIAIREHALQDLARVLYNAGKLSHRVAFNLPSVSTDIFLTP